MQKIGLVTFPVDLGSVSLSNSFYEMLQNKCDITNFIFSHNEKSSSSYGKLFRIKSRIISAIKLRKFLICAKKENRVIIFQQISPALFSLPFIPSGLKCFIYLDWTRKLYEPITGVNMSPFLLTAIHKIVLNRVTGVLAFTQAARNSLIKDYGVNDDRIHCIPMPFDMMNFDQSPVRDGPVRIVFVGGDFIRKGGDMLLRWFQKGENSAKADVTFVTTSRFDFPNGVNVIRNNPSHSAKSLLSEFDVLVLPTKYDAFPLAIGEALAAGLAIIVTENALGGPEVIDEGVNGFIVKSEEELNDKLDLISRSRSLVENLKYNSRLKAINFSYSVVYDVLNRVIYEN